MKRFLIILAIFTGVTLFPTQSLHAQIPIVEIIKAAVKKVIKAVDLQIQRQQNKVIWLQNAQKTLENTMAKARLDEISDWMERQRLIYQEYYEELRKVKLLISGYSRIRQITQKQVQLIEEYKRAYGLLKLDKHFTPKELSYMARVYAGIINESVNNLDQIFLIINSFKTQMTDFKRLELINTVADQIDGNYNDMRAVTQQGILLSLQRAKEQTDVDVVKKLYGLR